MLRRLHFSLSLSCLTLLTVASCQKKPEPEPTPQLEGTWNIQYKQQTEYHPDGTVWNNSDRYPATGQWIFTDSQLTTSDANNFPSGYSRQGDTLTITGTRPTPFSYKMTINKMTRTDLNLQRVFVSGRGTYSIVQYYFTR